MTNFKYDAAFYEAFDEEERLLKKFLPGKLTAYFTWKSIQEDSPGEIPPAPIISTRTQSKIPLGWSGHLKGIITRSTGYDHITEYLRETRKTISCAYLPDYAARAVAEQAMMLWTVLLRNLSAQRSSLGNFHRDGLTGREIRGKNISVIGVGRIGGELVDIASGLGMKVRGVDITPREEMIKKYSIEYLPMDDALKCADIAVCALPLTKITRGMLDYNRLSTVPKGAIFINIARGEISPSQDILRLLDEGKLGGVGLDVYDYEKEMAAVLRDGMKIESLRPEARESVSATIALMKHPRAVLTPHNAFNTIESVERKCMRTAENLESFLNNGKFITPCP